jgi:hypothetical protein
VRVGIVCEGSTDFAVLRVVCGELLGTKDLIVTLLQPRLDLLAARARASRGGSAPASAALPDSPSTPGGGWQGVRQFLQQTGRTLAASDQDLIVVHVDADIRHLPEVARHLGADAVEDLAPLCAHVKGWMPGGVPESVVIVLPREATEAWLCAVATHRADVEAIPRPADALRDAGVLGERGGTAEKLASTYETLAAGLGPLLRDGRKLARLPELARFVGKVSARAKVVRRGARRGRGPA